MVDPYAIVRRLTGHELISPKDARLLTEAVDGLIDEIGSKDTRIADLEAENERLASERDYWQSQHDERTRQLGQAEDEALSRTGAVKVKALEWKDIHQRRSDEGPTTEVVGYEAGIPGLWWRIDVEASDFSLVSPEYSHQTFGTLEAAQAAAQQDYERRILAALEPAARDANTVASHETTNVEDKPAASGVKDTEAARDALRELANVKMDLSLEDWCRISNTILSALETDATEGQQEPVAFRWRNTIDPTIWNVGFAHQAPSYAELEPLYTRPSEQAVTEAARAVCDNAKLVDIGKNGAFNYVVSPYLIDALKAAMEAER